MSSGDPETRKRILEATRELVEHSRGKAVRMEDIARRAGVSRQALYLHFGSRMDLMVATVQHVDEAGGFFDRTRHVREAENGVAALNLFVAFWADYVPGVFGLAKILLATRETDPAAAAAWADRTNGLWNIFHYLTKWIERDGMLASQWTPETAADMVWTLISVQSWESLVIERGWSQEEYVERIQETLRRVLIRAD